MRLLVVDTETTGLDPHKHGLLSLAGVVWEDGIIKNTINVLSKYNEDFDVDPKAMAVNKIDLDEHDTIAMECDKAALVFDDFVEDQFGQQVTLVGHNVSFDYDFICQLYRRVGAPMLPRFRYRKIDTHSIAAALQLAGKIPAEQKLDLTSLLDYFNIRINDGARHTALGDAVATAELLTKLVYFTKWGQPGCNVCGPMYSCSDHIPMYAIKEVFE